MAETPTTLCLFTLPDGTVYCASCDSPPEGGTYLKPAPEGVAEGPVDPRMLRKFRPE